MRSALASDLLSTADAARILDLSADMVRLLARDGRLPIAAETVRGVRLFRKQDVEALAAERAGVPDRTHVVQFYERPEFLHGVAAQFVEDGLRGRGTALVIATKECARGVLERLASLGRDVEQSLGTGRLVVVDARQLLDQSLNRGKPNVESFRRLVSKCLAETRAAAPRETSRVYSEVVDLLSCSGQIEAALQFEELWNQLVDEHAVAKLCGHSIAQFSTGEDCRRFEQLCDLHSKVLPTERYVDRTDVDDHLRKVAVLEQRERALQREMLLRQRAERALRALGHEATSVRVVRKRGAR
jgi:hypothetical protein